MNSPTKIAVVGAGLIGQRHIKTVQDSPIATLNAVVDPSPQAEEFARSLGLPLYTNLAELIAKDAPDGCVIATPNQLHVENALECIHAHIPVLIEKPISDNTVSATALVDEANRLDVDILVGHHRRHNAIIKAAKSRIAAKDIGRIATVQAMCCFYKPDAYFDVQWRTQPGAGPIFINLIHDIDLLRHLVGEISSVHAVEANAIRGHEVEDTAAIIVQFCSGALGTVVVSDTAVSPWSWELTAAENSAYPATGQNCYFISGTQGAIEIPTGKTWSQNGAPNWWHPIEQHAHSVEVEDPIDVQLRHFCGVINGSERPLVSGEEGLKSLAVVEAIKQSAQTNRPVLIKSTS